MQVPKANEMKLDGPRELFLQEKTPIMLCGFSGGADSTAALLTAYQLQQDCGFSLVAVHFDHGLRSESAEEAEYCRKFCSDREIEFLSVKLNIRHSESGIENAARQARLAEWKKLSQQYNNAAVITGHHANDRCENLFLRLFRGSNVSGLTGLRSTSVVEKVKFIRPLLTFSRVEIEEFLRENNVHSWVTDKSNFDSAMLRNYLRNEILPGIVKKIPFADSGLMKSVDSLLCDADYIESQAEEIFKSSNINDRKFWCDLHDAVAVRILRKFLSVNSGCDIPVSSDSFFRFKAAVAVKNSEAKIVPVGKDLNIIIQNDAVDVLKNAPVQIFWNWKKVQSVKFGDITFFCRYTDGPDKTGAHCASFDADLLDDTVVLSVPETGERFVPFGRKNSESIKKLRVDRKIPAYPVLPVMRLEGGKALWLPFIRNGNDFTVSDKTKKTVTFYASKDSISDKR